MLSSHSGPGDFAGHAERGGQRQQRREGEVLEQQDAQRQPRVRAREFHLVAELPQHDRGGRHRERAADDDGGAGVDAEGESHAAESQAAQQHLQATDAEHLGFHRDHAAQREFQAEREHQEHDADLGEHLHGSDARHEAERMRAEHHADQQVAEDRRQLEAAHQAQHEQRAREQDQDLAEKVVRHRASRGGCTDASIPTRHSRPWRSTCSPDRSRAPGQPPSCRIPPHSRPASIPPRGG